MRKLLTILCILFTLNLSAQSVNFTGVGKKDVKKTLEDYGFDTNSKSNILTGVSVITAYNEEAGIFSLYVFLKRKCVESYISFIGQDEDFWLATLDSSLEQFNDITWVDPNNRQLYILYFDDTLEQWVVKITMY